MTSANESTQRQLYGIAIFEEEIVLSDFTAVTERRFCLSPEQLMDFFRSAVTLRPFPGLVWMRSSGDGETYLLTLPAAERTILYRKAGKPNRNLEHEGKGKLTALRLRLPALAVRAEVDSASRAIRAIHLWGFSGKSLVADSVLYELPLPNLSGHSLCLGSTERAVEGDVLGAVERTIFDTPFNHHAHLCGREQLPFPAYVKKYKGRCPLRTLKRIGAGRDILGGDR